VGVVSLDEQKQQLIRKAERMYGEIFPCVNKSTLEECFTTAANNSLVLWFNTADNSTHMVASDDVAVYSVMTLEKLKRK
jgi:hypothetical protein